MATKRKRAVVKRTTATRRRTTSTIGKVQTNGILAIVGGALAAKFVQKFVPQSISPNIVNGALIAMPFVLPMLSKTGSQKQMLMMLGSGMAATGTLTLAQNMGIVSGLDTNDIVSIDLSDIDRIAGTINVLGSSPVVGKEISTVQGIQEISTVQGLRY